MRNTAADREAEVGPIDSEENLYFEQSRKDFVKIFVNGEYCE
jgi:hypothetical protein